MAYGIGPTATNLLDMPYGGQSPIAPAGITDAQRQGQLTTLGGLAAQYGPAQQYAQQAGQFAQGMQQDFGNRMQGGTFGWNPQLNNAYNQAGNTLNQFGGGYSGSMANQINQTGASFNPFNNPALSEHIGQANQLLGRDFNQQVMPQLNRDIAGAGPGAYGGTRAGVAQGLREQGLADAMQRQTTDMLNSGYEAGLNRYVQDRGTTVDATLQALQTGGQLGLQGAELQGNLGQNSLAQNNEMYQFGLGAIPGLQQNAYQAGIQPSQIQQNIGNALQGYGAQQQAANQNTANWYNQNFNAAQQYPQTAFNNYAAGINPLTTGSAGGQAMPQQNSYLAAAGGGLAGYQVGNTWGNSSNIGSTVPTTPAGTAAQYGTVPGSAQTNQLYAQNNLWS